VLEAQADAASRQSDLIAAENTLAVARQTLAQLVYYRPAGTFVPRTLEPSETAEPEEVSVDLDDTLAVALAERPEIQASARGATVAVRRLGIRGLRPDAHQRLQRLLLRAPLPGPALERVRREPVHGDPHRAFGSGAEPSPAAVQRDPRGAAGDRRPGLEPPADRHDTRRARAGRGEPPQPDEAARGRHGDDQGPARLPDPADDCARRRG